MEKTNIAELLEDCPKGMELYSPIFGDVYLDKVRPHLAIVVTTKEPGDFKEEFLYDGRYGMNGECMLFPSKGKTTWEGFVPPCKFKDGDILTTYLGSIFVIKEASEKEYYCGCYIALNLESRILINYTQFCAKKDCRLATEEEKQKLFKAIKDSGYKWNEETKTVEALIEPKFKVGDMIAEKNGITKPFVISQVGGGFYYANDKNAVRIMRIEDQDNYVFIPNKFDITTLIPFESRVLVRDYNNDIWKVSFWGCILDSGNGFKHDTVRGRYRQCIPYENNEHLLGKTDECNEYYKTWE